MNTKAASLAQLVFDEAVTRMGGTLTTVQRMVALNEAIQAYEGARKLPDRLTIVTRHDRRLNKNRRTTDSMIVAILEPEEQAAQVERLYNAVPIEHREEIGLTYAHVRAVLESLR